MADFILWLSSTASVALRKGMAEAVVAQRHIHMDLRQPRQSSDLNPSRNSLLGRNIVVSRNK